MFSTVLDRALALFKNAWDMALKHVFLPELNLWQNPAKKLSNFCSGFLDITTFPEPLLFNDFRNDLKII